MPSSGKVHNQLLGEPPDVSRKTTVNGAVPLIEFGATVPLPVKAAFGAGSAGPPAPGSVIPALTGNVDDDETVIELPRMFEMPGVMTPKVHDIATVTVSPMSVPLKTGAGAVGTPPTIGSWQFVAEASLRICAW